MISQHYVEQNREAHKSPNYGATGGLKWGDLVKTVCQAYSSRDVLDYGAGKRSLERTLYDYSVTSYDPAIEEISERPRNHDIVCCLDVLEHIEPEYLNDVIEDLRNLTNKALVLVIATGPAKRILPDGRNAHLIQEKYPFWLDKLKDFNLMQFSNRGYNLVFVVEPND